jgi:hypothetical protein
VALDGVQHQTLQAVSQAVEAVHGRVRQEHPVLVTVSEGVGKVGVGPTDNGAPQDARGVVWLFRHDHDLVDKDLVVLEQVLQRAKLLAQIMEFRYDFGAPDPALAILFNISQAFKLRTPRVRQIHTALCSTFGV